MKYSIGRLQSIFVLLLFTSIGFGPLGCSSNINNNSNGDAGGGGGQCGDGICDTDEDEFSCSQDCAATRCDDSCDEGRVHFCDENGNDASFACPESVGSTCILDSLGWPACSCGSISTSGTCYEDSSIDVDLVECTDGIAQLFSCLEGTNCDADGNGGAGCFCDNQDDGICPDAVCTGDPDCSQCTPNCNGSVCGNNGCGGNCGSCQPTQNCRGGNCENNCTPNCGGNECGPDGCGGVCGGCGSGVCENGTCTGGGSCSTLNLTFNYDASGVDWTTTFKVVVSLKQPRPIFGSSYFDNQSLRESTPSGSFFVPVVCLTCPGEQNCRERNTEVTRKYISLEGDQCTITDLIDFETIVIPPATFDGVGGCTAAQL